MTLDDEPSSDLLTTIEQMMSSNPTPAGGSAAASAVAHGAALLCKSVRVGSRREPSEGQRALADRLATLARRAAAHFALDSSAFDEVLAARRTDDTARQRVAWERATKAPIKLASLAMDALVELPEVRRCAPRAMSADVDAANRLLNVGIAISLANARANLVASRALAPQSLEGELARMSQRARTLSNTSDQERNAIVQATKSACVRAAADAARDGGYAGLCSEGQLDLAVDAIRGVSSHDVVSLLESDD